MTAFPSNRDLAGEIAIIGLFEYLLIQGARNMARRIPTPYWLRALRGRGFLP
jgi:hypothetical protein